MARQAKTLGSTLVPLASQGEHDQPWPPGALRPGDRVDILLTLDLSKGLTPPHDQTETAATVTGAAAGNGAEISTQLTMQNVQILAIGPNHPFSQKAFAASLHLPYPVLSDWPDLKVARHYGIASTRQPLAQLGISERAFFLIDKEGIIRKVYLKVNTQNHPEEVLAYVKENLTDKPKEKDKK